MVLESKAVSVALTRIGSLNDRQLLEEIYTELLAIAADSTQEMLFIPKGYTGTTSPAPDSVTPLFTRVTKTFNFILQNNGATGTGDLVIGDNNVQAIHVPAQQALFYTFTHSNYKTDLGKWYVKCSTASQPYGILVFVEG